MSERDILTFFWIAIVILLFMTFQKGNDKMYTNGFSYGTAQPTKRDGAVVSVSVTQFHIEVVGELGKVEVENFDNGIVRIYNDVRRIEFKQFTKDEYDGRVFGWSWEDVKSYAYTPYVSSTR